jgi:RNA-binding protein Musashi
MDSDQGKLFIGGISWDTNEEKLKEHFSNYGDVLNTSVMREKNTGKPRGFGFVVFSDPSVLDRVLEDKHVIDGRTVNASPIFIFFFSFFVFSRHFHSMFCCSLFV